MNFSRRIQNIEESQSIKLAKTLGQIQQQGKDVIPFYLGETDFPTPQVIIKATQKALEANQTRYSAVEGILELRQAIAHKLKRDCALPVNSENIFLGNGSKHILYNIFQTILNPGDEVLIPRPYWITFPESIKLAGGKALLVDTDQRHQLSMEKIRKALSPKTKAILINSPNNPTGVVYSKESLQALAQLALEKDFLIISDEAYEALTYEHFKAISIASLSKESFERTITVQSFSKTYSMTGFRLGYMVATTEFIKGVNKLQSHLSGNNCTFAQYGGLAALENHEEIISEILEEMNQRRQLALELATPLFKMEKPQGAFYLFADIRPYLSEKIPDDKTFALSLLEKTGVALLPGSYFGSPGFLRISFTTSLKNLYTGFSLLKKFIDTAL